MATDDAVKALLDLEARLELEAGEVCDCRCHRDRTLRHIGPCCRRCPGCRRRILLHKIKQHESKCPARAV